MFDSYETIFRARADRYQAAMASFPAARDAEFAIMVAPLGAHATVIDMPAGGGYMRRYLPAHAHYIAVEPAPQFFETCPEDAQARRVQSAIEAVPLPDACADALLCLAGLHHAPDLAVIFAEMRRLLRPADLLVLADVEAGSAPDFFLNDYVHHHSIMGHQGVFLGGSTAPQLVAAGFDILADAQMMIPWGFQNREAAGHFCRDMFGIEGQSAEQVADALENIVGLGVGPLGVEINWSLRRIVCTSTK
jgi:SAM-dependent methyltransferase